MANLRYEIGHPSNSALGIHRTLEVSNSAEAMRPRARFPVRSQSPLNYPEMAQQALLGRAVRAAPAAPAHPLLATIGSRDLDATLSTDRYSPARTVDLATNFYTPRSQDHRITDESNHANVAASSASPHHALPGMTPPPPPSHSERAGKKPRTLPESTSPSPDDHETKITYVRERKHACWMCHKSFDRPSTLRKHLLVHTGERAFACSTCGRRFGVVSNLNRHIRRCVLRPVNASAKAATTAPAPTATASDPPDPPAAPQATQQPPVKRRRRAPSPSRWVPHSLLAFNLSPPEAKRAAPVPLPPVHPQKYPGFEEERNSWDLSFGRRPYHPDGWLGKLPGPGLGKAPSPFEQFEMGRLVVA